MSNFFLLKAFLKGEVFILKKWEYLFVGAFLHDSEHVLILIFESGKKCQI